MDGTEEPQVLRLRPPLQQDEAWGPDDLDLQAVWRRGRRREGHGRPAVLSRRATPHATVGCHPVLMQLEFSGEVWEWRGPAPYYFVTVPEDESQALHDVAHVSYGWGMIPVTARLGATEWTTSLWPKGGGYVVPLKDAVRRAEHVEDGDL